MSRYGTRDGIPRGEEILLCVFFKRFTFNDSGTSTRMVGQKSDHLYFIRQPKRIKIPFLFLIFIILEHYKTIPP